MFRKLHVQLTLFFTSITSLILIVLSCACLFISENGIRKNMIVSFQKERNTMITHLQTQTTYSLQWTNQVQESSHYYLYLYDNGMPFYSRRFYTNEARDALVEEALAYAKSECRLDISYTASDVMPEYADFSITSENNDRYYASVGVIPKNKNALGFVLLYPLTSQTKQITSERILFAAVDTCAVFLLFLFSWLFTKKLLRPLEENRRKQIHFTASASHELRAPLTVILSGAEALEKSDTKEERAHFLYLIKTEGRRMQHLISDLLLLTHSDSGTFPVHITACQPDLLLLEAYEKYEAPARKKNLSLYLDLPNETLPCCHADPERIAQLFSILLDNALSYTPDGGIVRLALLVQKDGSGFLFRVSNNGPKIPDEQKELIFERFYRAQDSHTDKKHFGLGLCIAKEIVLAHRERLWVEDGDDGGVCFCFTLH